MATKTTGEVTIANTDYQRGAVFEKIDHDLIANAIRYLSYAKLYYPLEYGFFTKSLATHGATESIEDGNYILALYDFEEYFRNFLSAHPGVEQDVNRLSPKEMVDRVNEELVQETQARREAVRKTSKRVVAASIKQQRLQLNTLEIEKLEEEVGVAIRSSITGAATTQKLQQIIEERVAPIIPAQTTTRDREGVTQAIQEAIHEDPEVIQQIFLSDQKSQEEILELTVSTPLPNKRVLHTIITHLPMDPNETREGFLDRAESVAKTAMVLSSDLTQTPLARTTPAGFVEAILSIQKDRRAIDALVVFNKLTEQAKNAVSLVVVAEAWEKTVDAITKRAGEALVETFEPMIREAKRQSGVYTGNQSFKQAENLVGDILNPILGRTFADLSQLDSINRALPPGGGILPDKTGVAAFVDSLAAERKAEGTASAALFLASVSYVPGVRVETHHIEGSLAPVGVIRWAASSAFGRLMDRAAKSEAASGFFGKIFRPVLGFFGIRFGAQAVAGAAVGKATGAAAGTGIRALLARIGGTALGGAIGNIPGLIIGFVGGTLIEPVLKKGWQFVVNLFSLNFGAFGEATKAFGGRFSAHQRAGAVKKESETNWLIGIFVCGAILFPVVWNISDQISFQSGQVTSFEASRENQPDLFIEGGQIYPPPDYIDFSGLASKEFNCLRYGEGINTSHGPSGPLRSGQRSKIEETVASYPQIKLLSCSIGCTNPINITAFSEDGAYAGYAPSGKSGNIVFYPRAFGFQPQSFAKLLSHELAHNIDWRNSGLAEGFYGLGCEDTGTYPWKDEKTGRVATEETFAEAVGLYIIGWSNMRSYCGGKALTYFDGTLNQCR